MMQNLKMPVQVIFLVQVHFVH